MGSDDIMALVLTTRDLNELAWALARQLQRLGTDPVRAQRLARLRRAVLRSIPPEHRYMDPEAEP